MAAICVYCASSTRIDQHHVELASAVGTAIARRGHALVSGGGRISSMGAVARAARAEGGRTIGVIPVALVDLEVADHDADELVVTPDMRSRKGEMDRRSDAFLALPGGLGTLEELLEVWVAHSLGMHAKPVVVLDPDGVLKPLAVLVDDLVERKFVRRRSAAVPVWTRTVAEALDAVEAGLALAAAPPGAVVGAEAGAVAEEALEAEP